MSEMARSLAPSRFLLWPSVKAVRLSCHLICRSEKFSDTASFQNWDMNFIEMGVFSWEQVLVRLTAMGYQLMALLLATEGKTHSGPQKDPISTEQSPLWFKTLSLTADLSTDKTEARNGGIIPEMC